MEVNEDAGPLIGHPDGAVQKDRESRRHKSGRLSAGTIRWKADINQMFRIPFLFIGM